VTEYIVIWVTSVDAESPEEAAKAARAQQKEDRVDDQWFVKPLSQMEHHWEYRFDDMPEIYA
jgi:hypothetical protein